MLDGKVIEDLFLFLILALAGQTAGSNLMKFFQETQGSSGGDIEI